MKTQEFCLALCWCLITTIESWVAIQLAHSQPNHPRWSAKKRLKKYTKFIKYNDFERKQLFFQHKKRCHLQCSTSRNILFSSVFLYTSGINIYIYNGVYIYVHTSTFNLRDRAGGNRRTTRDVCNTRRIEHYELRRGWGEDGTLKVTKEVLW